MGNTGSCGTGGPARLLRSQSSARSSTTTPRMTSHIDKGVIRKTQMDKEGLKEGSTGTFHPKVTRHAWWRRALWALPGVFVFCCYTVTTLPIVRYLLVPWVRASRTSGLMVGATYAFLLVAVLY